MEYRAEGHKGKANAQAIENNASRIETIENALIQNGTIAALKTEQAYTTRQTAGGVNIVDEQYTPVTEIRGSTVRRESLIPYPYHNTTKTINGVTFTDNGDGSIGAKGTATANAWFDLWVNFSLPPNKNYTLSGNPDKDKTFIYITFSKNSQWYKDCYNISPPITITTEEDCVYRVRIIVREGATVDTVFQPMLNEGATALPYQPYFTGLKHAHIKAIKSTGRNLIPFVISDYPPSYVNNGVTFTVNSDGSFTANGTPTSNAFLAVKNFNLTLPAGTYTASGADGGAFGKYLIQVATRKENGEIKDTWNVTNGTTFTLKKEEKLLIQLVVYTGTTVKNLLFKPMINYGETALPYEPYTETTYQLPQTLELGEWDSFNPQTGKLTKQTGEIKFDGTEPWIRIGAYDYGSYPVLARVIKNSLTGSDNTAVNLVHNLFDDISANDLVTNKKTGIAYIQDMVSQALLLVRINPQIYGCTMTSSDEELIAGFEAYLANLSATGNPLTVDYKLGTPTITKIENAPKSYMSWNKGNETVIQGDTDNSAYGAMPTIKNEYFIAVGAEGGTNE